MPLCLQKYQVYMACISYKEWKHNFSKGLTLFESTLFLTLGITSSKLLIKNILWSIYSDYPKSWYEQLLISEMIKLVNNTHL